VTNLKGHAPMATEKFPEFEQTTWGKHFLAFEAAGLFESEEQRRELLRTTLLLYNRIKERWEIERCGKSGDGSDLW
jgi:hypothetical protein